MNISHPIVRAHINCHVTCHAPCGKTLLRPVYATSQIKHTGVPVWVLTLLPREFTKQQVQELRIANGMKSNPS